MAFQTITVLGAGTMGSGIAQSFASSGKQVKLYDINEQALQKGMVSIEKSLSRFVRAGHLTETQSKTTMKQIQTTIDLKEAVSETDFIIEAVPENLELKKNLFIQLDELAKPEIILATNTSELSVTAIGAVTKRPDKVVGMHWFNPAPVMKLIEIIRAVDTSEATISAIKHISEEIGKEVVIVKDSQGFVTTRVLAAHMLESIRMYEENIASREDIDKAVRLGLNYPMGPLQLADLIGLDTMLFVSEGLSAAYGDRFLAPQTLRKLVEAGHLGKKTGKGFYDYRS
ncbi:3-hydroxyacyl-CoA dehydrogenase family protein [Metabacillus arenae]|uniref:3-hydroxyacyl-CoA dehydrogenase family protein n=1 Tax=Metabacillus arenae TaxID=2771434 RepID=A0A926NH55_9BACI|nr:3-hydroxyacyl-CoA dehydrogenase family protein [Metabacillus arenae]MBD1383369.1 3-hydroxyacyl-CoA dehydrogenase family protein [Metabacillus arenae]